MATGIDERKRGDGKTSYQAHVWDARNGKRIRKTFDNKTAAKQWRTDAMAALRAGTMTTSRGPTLNDAVDKWLDALRDGHVRNRSGDPYKPSAIRGYEHCLRHRVLPQLGHMRLGEIRPQDVQRLVDHLVEKRCAAATIDSALTPLRALYRRAVARGEVTTNPTLRIEKPAVRCKVRIVASPVEAATRLDALDCEDRPLWATAFYAGLRRGELIGLRWEDVDLATGVIHVRRGWDEVEGEIAPKSRQGRRAVPIPAVLRDYLLEHRMATMGDGRVFNAARQVRTQAERAGKRWTDQGLDRLTLHCARHTYASLMIAAGVNAKALSTFMGHANIGITLDLYGHMMPGSEAEAATLLDTYLAREVDGSTVAQTVADTANAAA
jgi:integrase